MILVNLGSPELRSRVNIVLDSSPNDKWLHDHFEMIVVVLTVLWAIVVYWWRSITRRFATVEAIEAMENRLSRKIDELKDYHVDDTNELKKLLIKQGSKE